MLHFRPLLKSDQSTLWHWLHVALWDPPPAPLRPLNTLENPGVRIYAEDWGEATDVGVVAVVDGQDAGACWMRLVTGGRGLAFVDEYINACASVNDDDSPINDDASNKSQRRRSATSRE